jgi:MATE family multidrug resistance protein
MLILLERWSKPNGYRDVLSISLPLVASMGSYTLMQFTDRMFLAKYSIDSISAVLPAGIVSFTFISLFMGVASYTNAFVSQYFGAKALDRIGAALWQGLYFALMAGILIASLYFFSRPLFNLIGHAPAIRALEIRYFNILILGGGLAILNTVLSSFYTGRGMTWTVMLANLSGTVANIPLNYCLIYGKGPFPELGIAGSALATVVASAVIVLIYCVLIFTPANRVAFGTWRNRAFNKELFGRLMRFGLPSGIQFFLEIFGFTFFIQMLGRLGGLELAASNIVLSIESLAFMPMVGFNIGNATLVGQAIGRGKPEDGVYATTSALHITLTYMLLLAAVFVLTPEPLLRLFKSGRLEASQYDAIMNLGVVLLRFVALFSFFDSMNLIFSGAIKGAGDTRFIMWTIGGLSVGVMMVPVYLAVVVFGAGLYTAWTIVTLYICSLGLAFFLRYRSGKWKKMHVIEARLINRE